ncbi:MAG TPA: ABC transporter ATP-binding protein, partial [Chloroflexi bacterium]|nr:ABC transporter ATP-binding protein [Chloroflexota bacterium]
DLLTRLGLWERRKERGRTWSRGMKQKLALARALLHRPSLIFLDEPTAGLDPVAAAAVQEDLATLVAREGVTVFLTTHNLAEAEKLCHLVGVIREGRLLAVGSLNELRSRARAPQVTVTGRGFTDEVLALLRARPEVTEAALQNSVLSLTLRKRTEIAPLVAALVKAGVQVDEVRRDEVSLEEVFLTLMEEAQ